MMLWHKLRQKKKKEKKREKKRKLLLNDLWSNQNHSIVEQILH